MASAKHLKLTYEILEGYKNLLTRKLQVRLSMILHKFSDFPFIALFVLRVHQTNSIHHLLFQDTATTASYYLQCCLMNANDKEFVGRMAPTAPIPLVPSLQSGAVQCNVLEVWLKYFNVYCM